MRIVITGASGNVGSALLRRLGPDHQLVGIARRLPEPGFGHDGVRWVSADLSDPSCSQTLHGTFDGADAVVHLAWGFQPSHDLDYLERLGVGGTTRVVDAVRVQGVPHLVHMSSVGAYSPKEDDQPVDESWPTGGVPSSPYSRHKAAAERLLDDFEAAGHPTVVSRMRPGIVAQRSAGSELLRYGVPGLLPGSVVDLLPVLPLDLGLAIPMVHADDVAEAFAQVLERRAPGAFNLQAEPPVTTARLAEALGARPVHVPARVVRVAMAAAWHLRLQQVDPGWLDLGFAVPLMDTSRAARVLDWSPRKDAVTVLEELLDGMRTTAADDASPVLRHRTVLHQLTDAVRRGPVSSRQQP